MAAVRNVLFIMCDQLRADHLSCYGHPHLHTPNIDRLARQGVKFERAFVQSGVCGPSRMSFYTGRYMASHGATWNRVPLAVGEWTLGDYLRQAGRKAVLAGKTHMVPDHQGINRLQLDGDSELETLLAGGGFTSIDRYDGHSPPDKESGYADYLRAHGYDSADPWTDYVISVTKADGNIASGWSMRNVGNPARVKAEHSETPYMTDQALRFIREQGDAPWVMHLSYVKPHWPYVAPAPYHAMYAPAQCLPVKRHSMERANPHPVYAAYQRHEESRNFAHDEVVATVRPVYQGLIKQLDDELGRVWAALEELGRWDDTLIVFTADHGDFLGDHWLGEKEQFHDTVQRVPLLVYDPDPAADATRGHAETRFAESVDAVPTVLDALGIAWPGERIEGRSLLDLIRQREADGWRHAVYSELDYSFREARLLLHRDVDECRAWMIRTDEWKFVHWQGFRPQLFDLLNDPDEFLDLGADPNCTQVRMELKEALFDWLSRRKIRTTITDHEVARRTNRHKQHGVFFGQW
jgi:arylsulfatase A-like enzyme